MPRTTQDRDLDLPRRSSAGRWLVGLGIWCLLAGLASAGRSPVRGGKTPASPALSAASVGAASRPGTPATSGTLAWVEDLDEALDQARREQKLVLLDGFAHWCGPCRIMEKFTYPDPGVQAALSEHFVPLKVNVDDDPYLAQRFQLRALPTTLVLDAYGVPLLRQSGLLDPASLKLVLESGRRKGAESEAALDQLRAAATTPSATLDLGEELLRRRRYDDASSSLQKAWASSLPEDEDDDGVRPRANLALGLTLANLRQFEAAIPRLRKAAGRGAEDEIGESARHILPRALLLWGLEREKDGDVDGARALFAEVSRDHPDTPAADQAARLEALRAKVGEPAPEWTVDEWVKGEPTTLAALRGQVVLLDFFQILCRGCAQVHPTVANLARDEAEAGLQVIGLAVAFEAHDQQTPAAIRAHVAEGDFPFRVALDKDLLQTFRAYGGAGTPYGALVDRKGVLRWVGFLQPKALRRRVKELLAED